MIFTLFSTFLLSSCFEQEKIACSNPNAETVIKQIISENVKKQLKNDSSFGISNIRATINNVDLKLASIRTTKTDPNSTKVFCEANLVFTPSLDILSDAKKVLSETKNIDVEDFLDQFHFKQSTQSANSYESTLVYDLQPSDDKKTLFTNMDSPQIIKGISHFLHLSLSKDNVLREIEARKQADKKQQELEVKRQAELELKKNEIELAQKKRESELKLQELEYRQALLREEQQKRIELKKQTAQQFNEIKAENKQAFNEINAVWKSLSPDVRKQLLPQQRKWISEKETICKKNATNSGLIGEEKEAIRLACDTQMSRERIEFLNKYLF